LQEVIHLAVDANHQYLRERLVRLRRMMKQESRRKPLKVLIQENEQGVFVGMERDLMQLAGELVLTTVVLIIGCINK
jgi:hypothetical protein